MCVNLQHMKETGLFSGKIYTAGKKFTRPPVATNFKSAKPLQLYQRQSLDSSAGYIDTWWVPLGITDDDLRTSWALPGFNLGMTFLALHNSISWSTWFLRVSGLSGLIIYIYISLPSSIFHQPDNREILHCNILRNIWLCLKWRRGQFVKFWELEECFLFTAKSYTPQTQV